MDKEQLPRHVLHAAVFPLTVLLFIVSVPPLLIPPPKAQQWGQVHSLPPALFPLMVLLLIVSEPVL
jgi:hypothetical protein